MKNKQKKKCRLLDAGKKKKAQMILRPCVELCFGQYLPKAFFVFELPNSGAIGIDEK